MSLGIRYTINIIRLNYEASNQFLVLSGSLGRFSGGIDIDTVLYTKSETSETTIPESILFVSYEVKPYRNPTYRNSYVEQQGVFSGRTFFIFLRN